MKCCEYDNRSVAKVTRCQDYKNVGFFVTDHSKLDCMSLTSFKGKSYVCGYGQDPALSVNITIGWENLPEGLKVMTYQQILLKNLPEVNTLAYFTFASTNINGFIALTPRAASYTLLWP